MDKIKEKKYFGLIKKRPIRRVSNLSLLVCVIFYEINERRNTYTLFCAWRCNLFGFEFERIPT